MSFEVWKSDKGADIKKKAVHIIVCNNLEHTVNQLQNIVVKPEFGQRISIT